MSVRTGSVPIRNHEHRKGIPMTYQCLIIDDEKLLADSTAEYFNLFGVKTAAVYSVISPLSSRQLKYLK